jgi:hypothetical protein
MAKTAEELKKLAVAAAPSAGQGLALDPRGLVPAPLLTQVLNNGALVGRRRRINLIAAGVVGLNFTDTPATDSVDVIVSVAPTYSNYTPTWTSDGTQPAIGNATVVARYLQIGKQVHAWGQITFGSTSTFGTGTYKFALPVAASASVSRLFGMVDMFDNSTGFRGWAMAEPSGSSNFLAAYPSVWPAGGTTTVVVQTQPWTWAVSDFIAWNLMYEAA